MTDLSILRRIFEADQAGPPPRPTLRQSHDRVFALLVQGLREAEESSDRAAVRTYCHMIDHLKSLYPTIYPSWHRRSGYWKGSE